MSIRSLLSLGAVAAIVAAGLVPQAALAAPAADSAAKPATPTAKPTVAKPVVAKPVAAKPVAAKPAKATSRQELDSEAKGLALASQTAAQISAGQLDVASRVLTGVAECEFRHQVHVAAVDGKPGHFTVSHQGKRYSMLPEETSTGAVRLEDKKAGIVWLQIPAKSMLMNSKLGQRMVDNCTQPEQRAAVAAVQAAASSPEGATTAAGGLGITSAPTR